MSIPTMKEAMEVDLSELFDRDMPTTARIGQRQYTVLLDDLLNEEVEGYGGPEAVEMQRVHFKASDISFIEVGANLIIAGKSKIVVSSVLSADGNELIATARGD